MAHDPKLVAAIEAAIITAIQQHDMSDSQLYWMGGSEPSEERCIIATAALDAITAAGCVVVPVEPTPGLLMSMALRRDHGLGARGSALRIRFGMNDARQQHEEVVGKGFYRPEKEAEYAAVAARPGAQP